MDVSDQITLGTEPLPETEETLLLEVSSDSRGIGQKKELEGKITLNPGRCLIYSISPIAGHPSSDFLLPERTKWDFYLLIIPYTLHQAARDHYYEEVTFFVEMTNPEITAFDLFPKFVTAETEGPKTYTLSSNLKFQEVEAGVEKTGKELCFHALRPAITALGESESTFYWVHKGFKKQEVLSETKYGLAVLQVPAGLHSIEATISYEVVSARKFLGIWKSIYGETQPCKVSWPLQGSPSFFREPEKDIHPNQQKIFSQKSVTAESSTKVLKVFYSYAHADQDYRKQLEKHLSNLVRRYHLQTWFDRQINPGDQWQSVLDEHLNTADLILLLISPDFMASNYCYNNEMGRALERHAKGEAKVVPILIRRVHWTEAPFSILQMLPTDALPVKSWTDLDEAFYDVVKGIEKVIQDLLKSS